MAEDLVSEAEDLVSEAEVSATLIMVYCASCRSEVCEGCWIFNFLSISKESEV